MSYGTPSRLLIASLGVVGLLAAMAWSEFRPRLVIIPVQLPAAATPSPTTALTKGLGSLLYVSQESTGSAGGDFSLNIYDLSSGQESKGNDPYKNYARQMYISPDRKLLAVSMSPTGTEAPEVTYLADSEGKALTDYHPGSFVSWAPDSSRAYLFLSDSQNVAGRAIYQLDAQDRYQDAGFPLGTIDVATNPIDGRIVYSLARQGSDQSDLWVRGKDNKDALFLKGDSQTFAWMGWSPDGTKLAYMAYELSADSAARQGIWLVGSGGTGPKRIDDVAWSFPFSWSADGSRLAYAKPAGEGSDIWEYDLSSSAKRQVTSLGGKNATEPTYALDGSLIFVSDQNGSSQVWKASGNGLIQLTTTSGTKSYPVAY
jgi:Tol biopolymer transport system component